MQSALFSVVYLAALTSLVTSVCVGPWNAVHIDCEEGHWRQSFTFGLFGFDREFVFERDVDGSHRSLWRCGDVDSALCGRQRTASVAALVGYVPECVDRCQDLKSIKFYKAKNAHSTPTVSEIQNQMFKFGPLEGGFQTVCCPAGRAAQCDANC